MQLKTDILRSLVEALSNEIAWLKADQEKARQAATHEESRPENEHDTRAVEASYLAAGQAQRFEALSRELGLLRDFPVRAWQDDQLIAAGALIELESSEGTNTYFLLPFAGGRKVEVDGETIQTLTTESPLGAELLDKVVGDEVIFRGRSFEVASVR